MNYRSRRPVLGFITLLGLVALTACQKSQPTPEPRIPTATKEIATLKPSATLAPVKASSTPRPSHTATRLAPTATNTRVPATQTPLPTKTATRTATIAATSTLAPSVTPTPVPALTRALSLQDPRLQGDDVMLLQQRLLELGYTEVGTPDGVFGKMTETAVIRFQTDAGLTADGIVGSGTWAALWGMNVAAVTPLPSPTSEYAISRTVNAPGNPISSMIFDGEALWLAVPGASLYKIDPVTGKQLSKVSTGCKVCFGMCELFVMASDGQNFWTLQYGSLQEEDCNSDDPWQHIGFMLRMTRPGTDASKVLDVSPYLNNATSPNEAVMAVVGNTIWLGVEETIYVIDTEQSSEEGVVMLKTFYPGIYMQAMLFANDQVWVAGEALLSIDPNSYQTTGVYNLPAVDLAFDGERIWGISDGDQWVRGMDVTTRELTAPIPLPEIMPNALAFDGQNLWVAFAFSSEMVVIKIK